MLITPEQDNSVNSERVVPNFQDTIDTEQDMNNIDNSHCCNPTLKQSEPHEMDNNNSYVTSGLSCLKLTGPNFSPPRQGQKLSSKFGPLNNLITGTHKKNSPRFVKKALFLAGDDDNDVFSPPSPVSNASSPPRCPSLFSTNEVDKQEVIAGRLYLIRQIGNASQGCASPSSPSRSFVKPFSFSSPAKSSPTSSPQSPQSPTAKRKLPVYVRVYKCNMDHFALVSRDSSYSSGHMYLNMRHCRVLPGDPLGRFIIAGNSDSGSLMEFETPDLNSLESWLDALQTQTPPESPIRSSNNSNSAGAGGAKNGGNSSGSPSIPKSPGLPTLTEAEDEDRQA